jgi:DnaJ domain
MARKIFEGLGAGTLIPRRGSLPLNDPRIGPEEGFVLSRIDGRTSLQEVCMLVPFEEQVAMVILRKLWEIGAIEVPGVARVLPKQQPPAPPPSPSIRPMSMPVPVPPAPPKENANPNELSAEEVRRVDEVFASLDKKDAFELLELEREAEPKDIKRAYFKLSKEFHPDRFYVKADAEEKRKLTAIFTAVKSAFEILSDEKRRIAYLESLK